MDCLRVPTEEEAEEQRTAALAFQYTETAQNFCTVIPMRMYKDPIGKTLIADPHAKHCKRWPTDLLQQLPDIRKVLSMIDPELENVTSDRVPATEFTVIPMTLQRDGLGHYIISDLWGLEFEQWPNDITVPDIRDMLPKVMDVDIVIDCKSPPLGPLPPVADALLATEPPPLSPTITEETQTEEK